MKLTIYTRILILISIFTISINSVFSDSDFVLELQNVNKDPTISNLEIEGENVEEIYPTNKCKLEFTNSSFILPGPKNMTIDYSINFNLKYNNTDLNLDSTTKEY